MQTQYQPIFNAPMPSRRVNGLRQQPRKERAVQVRKMFKELGIKGVSVTTPNYSMAQAVDISLPDVTECVFESLTTEQKYSELGHLHFCPACKEKWAARDKIESILAEAFPDLDDRSDSQSDHFDYCFSIK